MTALVVVAGLFIATGHVPPVAAQQAPPRSVSDITAILDQEKPDPEKVAALQALVAAEPPADVQGADRAEFYYRRATAAAELGKLTQWTADLRQAAALAEARGGPINEILRDLAQAELVVVNLRDSVATARRRLDALDSEPPPRRLPAMGILVRALIAVGRVEAAHGVLEKMQNIAANLPARVPADRRVALEGVVADAESRFYQLTGKIEQAEEAARKAIDGANAQIEAKANNHGALRALEQKRDGLNVYRVGLLLRLNRPADAEVLARDVLLHSLRLRGKYAPMTGRAVAALQDAVYPQGRYAEAEALARAAEDILSTIGAPDNSVALLNARLDVARALSAGERWKDADSIVDRVTNDIDGNPALYDQTLGKMVEHVLIRYRNGRLEEGLKAVKALYKLRTDRFGDKHQRTAEARGFVAMGLFEAGELEESLSHFRAAMPILLSRSRDVDVDSTNISARDLRLRAIFDSYVALLGAIYQTRREAEPGFDIAAEAFLIADAARAGSVRRAVAQSSARAAARDPELAELVRKEQDLVREIGALYGLLTVQLSAPSEQRDEDVVDDLRQAIDALRGKRAELRERVERAFPDYIRLVDPPPTRLDDARAALRDHEALVVTYVSDTGSFVWAVGKEGEPGFSAAPLGRD